jgi:hypothetical protein
MRKISAQGIKEYDPTASYMHSNLQYIRKQQESKKNWNNLSYIYNSRSDLTT